LGLLDVNRSGLVEQPLVVLVDQIARNELAATRDDSELECLPVVYLDRIDDVAQISEGQPVC